MEQLARNTFFNCPPGILTVEIEEANNLNTSVFGALSPYVVIELDSQKAQSEIQKNTNKPIWKSKFYFKTEGVLESTDLIITVMTSNQVLSDKSLGNLKYSLVDIIESKKRNEYLKQNLLDETFKESKKVQGTLDLFISWQPDESETLKDKKLEGNMKKFNFDGVFKLNILSGTNLTSLDKFQSVFLEIFHDKQKNPKPLTTEKKAQKNAQFNQEFYFSIDKDKKLFSMNLVNVHKERFIAASYDLDLEQYSLDRHKPKSVDFKFENNKFKADVLCEMTFLYNFFTGNPQGTLRIEVLAIPKLPEKRKFYFRFYIDGPKERGDNEKFTKSGTVKQFKTEGRLDKVRLVCFEQSLTGDSNVAAGKFSLCDIPWAKPKENKDSVDYQNKKVVDMIGKDLNFQVRLDLKYRSADAFKSSTGGSVGENLEAKDSPDLKSSIPLLNALKSHSGENSPTKSNASMARSPTITTNKAGGLSKFATSDFSAVVAEENKSAVAGAGSTEGDKDFVAKSGVLVIKAVDLASFLLKVKLFELPNFYFSVSTEALKYAVFSSLSKSPIPRWDKESIAIYLTDIDQKIRIQLHELNFASVANQLKQPFPIDILCSEFVPNASKNSFGRTIFLTLPTQVSGEFKDFVKKNYITNDDEFVKDPVQALEKATFETSIDVYTSYFVDNPHGTLTLHAIDGRAISHTSAKGVTSTLDLKLQIGLGSQIFNLNDNVNASNPTWNPELNFYTHNPMDFLRVKLFDSDPMMNKMMMDLTIPLCKLEFTKDKQQFSYDVDLGKYEVCLKGVLTFKFTYSAQPNVSTQSLIRGDLVNKANKQNEETKTPVLADWKSLRNNEKVLMELILQDISLELKLKEEFVVTTEVKVSSQSYYSPRFANMPKCLVMKRLSFMLNPTNEDERFIYFNIKVFDKANPSKILRLYNYIFDWCKYLVNSQDYITAHFELLPSTVHSQDKNTINSITVKYRISTPQVANMSEFGTLGISPLQIRTAGASINDPQLWKNGKSYAIVISYNGMKQFYKARTGEPRKYEKSYVYDANDFSLPDKTYRTGQLFIDKIDGTESVLDFVKEHPNPKLFPYNKNNNRFLKVTLYQIDPEGLALSMLQLKSNPNARVMAKGVFDVYRLQKDYKGGVYALKLQKELVMNCDPSLIHPVNLQFLDLYLLFEIQESFLEYKENMSAGMQALKLAKEKAFAAKSVKELLSGVVSTKILRMTSCANERKDLIGNVVTVRVEKTSKKEDAKVTTTLKNLISNKQQLFVNPDVSFNPTESIFGKTVYFSLMDGPDPGVKLIDTVLKIGEENQDYVREQLRPELSITLKPLKEKVNLDGLPIGVGARVRVCPEVWNDNQLNSEIDLQFGYHENFFTESSKGKFTVSKFDLNSYGGAKIQDIHQIVFSIRNASNPELSNPADAFTIPLNQVGPNDESMKITRSISMNTTEKTSVVYIQFKDKSGNVLGKLKLNLFELLFINPQSIKKNTVEGSDLEQEKIFILPISNPKNPLGYIVFKMWFFYKDITSLTNVNFKDVMVLFKFKQVIRKRMEKLRRIVYLNPSLAPLVFPAKLARFFYGASTPQGISLPVFRMSKIEELKTKMAKALIPGAPDSKVLVKVHLPAKCSFILPGIVSLNQPILVKLSYTSISKSMNQAPEDKGQEIIVITQQLRLDNCTWEKIIQDNTTSFKFQLIDSIEFYVPEKDVLQNKVDLSFQYYSKNVGKATLKGLLDYTEFLTQELKSKTQSNKPQSVFLFLKPSNQKLFINISRISSGFVNNPIGKLHFQVHRLIILDDYKNSSEGHPYENRSLLLRSKVVKEFRSGNHLKFHLKVGMKLDNQKRFTPTMNHQGIPLDQVAKDYVFYTSSYNKDLSLSVLIDPNPPQKELGEEMVDHMENKALELNEDSTGPLANNIAIAKARVSLSSLPLSDGQTYPIYIPFSEINYPENDLFKLFFDSINRKNIYLLGSVSYKSEPWYNLGFRMEKISGLRVLSNEQDDEYSLLEKPKFGVVVEVTRKKDGGNLQSLRKYESMIYKIEKTDNNVLRFRDDENCGFVFEDTNPTEEITLNVSLSYYQRGNSQVFAKKSIPIRKYFMNNKDTEKPVTIDLGLTRDQKIRADFIDSKVTEFPMTLQFRVLSEYDTSTAASSKKAKKITKRNTLVFNYREHSLEEMMAAIVNSTDKTEIIETLKEIKEYLLYTIQEKEVDLPQATALYNIFRYVYQVYPDCNEMNQICIRNILALFNFDPKIIHKVNIVELFEDFNELLLSKWKQNGLEAKDEELVKIIAQFKTKFPKREGNFKTLQEVQTRTINEMKPADVLQYLKNNSLYKGDGEQAAGEDKEKDHKDLIKVLLYIVKVLDIVNASGEQYAGLIASKALKIVTKSVALFIKEEESLLAPFLKILRKVLVESENTECSVDQLKSTLDCLENTKLPSSDEQTESFLRIYAGIFNLLLSKVVANTQEQKATYKRIFNYLNLNYKEKDYYYHYQYFEILLNFAELYKNEIDFVQENLNRNDFSLKFMNYMGLIQKNMEVKLSDNEIKQSIDLVEEIVLKYDAKNVKVDKLIGYLQIMEEKGNVGSTTRLKIDFVIGKLKRMKDGTSAEKKKQLKDKLKTTATQGTKSSKDVNTKYLISKLDWM